MVAKQEIYEKHPELFHYTNDDGLAGILTSQNLRATHYRFLNDTTELQLMRVQLAERLYPFLNEILVEKFRQAGLKKKKEMRAAGGPNAIARDEARHLADTFYRTAFEDTQSGKALAIPFITSFCAHTSDQPYEQKNGLLSQWRGYAKGGYAIVFDTKKLCDLYKTEGEKFYYSTSHIGDVVYQGDEQGFVEEFGEGIEKIRDGFLKFIETGEMEVGEIFGDVLSMFTRLKHRGFFEEREVRSVAFPMTKEIEDEYKRVDPNYISPNKPMKEILMREDGAPYIEMLNFDDKTTLPITRIIVGPQENQAQAKQKIERLIEGKNIEVHCSETPLSWRGK